MQGQSQYEDCGMIRTIRANARDQVSNTVRQRKATRKATRWTTRNRTTLLDAVARLTACLNEARNCHKREAEEMRKEKADTQVALEVEDDEIRTALDTENAKAKVSLQREKDNMRALMEK